MKKLYRKPEIKSDIVIEVTALNQYLTALNACGPGSEGVDCESNGTGTLIFCAEGLTEASQLDGCTVTADFPSNGECPDSTSSILINCTENPEFQDNCDEFGGGLAVTCEATFDCDDIECSDANESPEGMSVSCGDGPQISCAALPE